jgi:hypothetical protein
MPGIHIHIIPQLQPIGTVAIGRIATIAIIIPAVTKRI